MAAQAAMTKYEMVNADFLCASISLLALISHDP